MKQLKDYLHYYIGSSMVRSSHWDPQNEQYVLTLENIKEAVEFDDRPFLWRLEDMSEEQAIEFLKHAVPGAEYCTHNEHAVIWQSLGSRCELFFSFGPPDGFHYLLQQGFDLFGLIDAGLALDSKTFIP